jgi:glucose-6-phosphate 1-dehydrogenase
MTLALAGKPGVGRVPRLQELSFAVQPGSDMRPYDRLIDASLDGNRLPFARQDAMEAAWRIVDPVLDEAVPIMRQSRSFSTPAAAGARRRADSLLPDGTSWHDPAD